MVFELDGIERVGWMLDAWSHALVLARNFPRPTMNEAIALGKMVERQQEQNWHTESGCARRNENVPTS